MLSTAESVRWTPLRLLLNAAGLGGLIWLAVHPGSDLTGPGPWALVAVIVLSWTLWMTGWLRRRTPVSLVVMAALAIAGGIAAGFSAAGVALLGVACWYAALVAELPGAVAITAGAVGAAVGTVLVVGLPGDQLLAAVFAAAAGLLGGLARRQQRERIRQEAQLALANQLADVERGRAELLAERAHVAREIHDVLAHTLSALSVQLNALDASAADTERTDLREGIARTRALVTDGLAETRRAVQTLRDEPIALTDQLRALALDAGAEFDLQGTGPAPPAGVALALLRVAQEAVTNARKHAPGAQVRIGLRAETARTVLTVTDAGAPSGPLSDTGGGYGLVGARERLELIGGTLIAGPHQDGWRVRAEVPG